MFLQINQEVYKVRRKVKWVEDLWQRLKLDYLENMICMFVVMYFGVFFHVMTLENIIKILVGTYFIPFIVLYITYVLVVVVKVLSAL